MSDHQISKQLLSDISGAFDVSGKPLGISPYGNGHINDTFVSTVADPAGGQRRYVYQRINTDVFIHPRELMDNVARVTEHLHRKFTDLGEDPFSRTLTLVPLKNAASDSRFMYEDPTGGYWRCYLYIENSCSYESLETPEQAYQASRCFGEFLRLCSDIPAPRLHETIVDFHHTPRRFDQLAAALASALEYRKQLAAAEIEFAMARRDRASRLVDMQAAGKLPERIAHNDTKVNNVLFDQSGRGMCVIDLDTVMPSLALYDFGDSVRLGANPAAEDERDLSLVHLDLDMFAELARGFVEGSGDMLTAAERDELVFSAWLISLEIAIRFLADYLAGDVYFRTHREGHNLDRCRSQLQLVRCIESADEQMRSIVSKL